MTCMEKQCCHFFTAVFYPILFILAGNDNMHESSKESQNKPDSISDYGASCPSQSEKYPYRLIMGKWYCHFFSSILDQIFCILAGNDDIHMSSDDFKIRPDPIRDHRISGS